ncbi:MAG: acyl-CoA dehydrogenase family protein, partial [Proteobacteria bacterium]|nr:acyl-CoA dehydrogenase family protein [Pseudomonadota bacterium]
MLKESARKLVAREIEPYLAGFPKDRAMTPDEIKGLLKLCLPLGYLGSILPEAYGGAGLDFTTWALLMEEMNPYIYLLIMLTVVPAIAINATGTEEQKRKFIPELISGERIGFGAITEPNVGSHTAAMETRATLEGDHYTINGSKMWITNGAFADLGTLLANTAPEKGARGLCSFIVDKNVSPFQAKATPILGDDPRMPHVGELRFEDCRVPAENRLGNPGEGLKNTLILFQIGRCLVALNSVIYAQQALDAAVRYARERTQFGKPIGQFQLIQQKIADMAALTDASRLLTYRAISLVDQGRRCPAEASMAKFYATEAAIEVTSMAIQVHGAYGLSEEYPVERLFRGARVMTIPDGTTEIQKLIVAREYLGMPAFV